MGLSNFRLSSLIATIGFFRWRPDYDSPLTPLHFMKNFIYLLLGVFFGFILTKTEVISWFRIQEMFRFQSFHMYGVIGSALAVGVISIQLIKRFHPETFDGQHH